MGFCFGDHLLKVSEEESCLPERQREAADARDMRVPPIHHPSLGQAEQPQMSPFPDLMQLLGFNSDSESSSDAIFSNNHANGDSNFPSFSGDTGKRTSNHVLDEEVIPAKKIRLDLPYKSILKKTRSRRRFSTPRRTFFVDSPTTLEYASSRPPCEIRYLAELQSQMSLCFDDGVWFKKTVYSSDDSS
ncbi:uncharacterized protein LOC108679560 [Hyalella azteca]|uniref:Uncharacterized protein LOC108679560 n=1 Tax=Hyalella azteca TaxID=294128 RepID=A0A8B7PC82_HYAAZ|nr:uncharacterized protein LOC108679560 [Hyalella azteca]